MWSGHKAGGLVGWSKQGKWILLSKVYQWCAWNCRAQWSQCRMSGLYLQLPKVFSCEECSSSRIHTTSRRCIKMCKNLPKMWSLNLSWINKRQTYFHLLEQCRNSKRTCDPRNMSTGIGSLIWSPQRGLLLWYNTKEWYSSTLGSPEPAVTWPWKI